MEILAYGIIYNRLYNFLVKKIDFTKYIYLEFFGIPVDIPFFIIIFIVIFTPFILKYLFNLSFLKNIIVRTYNRSAWDQFFSKREPCIVVIHFIDDSPTISGRFGANSFATSFPNKKEIYLEKIWELNEDGTFKEKDYSKGLYISCENIKFVEFFEL